MRYLKRYESYSDSPKVEIFANQVGPVMLTAATPTDDGFMLETSEGEFFINSMTYTDIKFDDGKLTKPKPGYTYVFEVDKDTITNVALATCDLVIFYEDTIALEKLAREHFPEDTGIHIDMREVWIERYKNSSDYKLQVLSIKRKNNPFMGLCANPGGFIDEGEQPLDAAGRELMEETGVYMPVDKLKFVGRFDKLNRDPRMKICVSYAFACILTEKPKATAQDDAADVTWLNVNVNDLKITDDSGTEVKMAFDHYDVIKKALASI